MKIQKQIEIENAKSISKSEIESLLSDGKFNFYNGAHCAMLNQNFDYRIFGNCVRVQSEGSRFYTIGFIK